MQLQTTLSNGNHVTELSDEEIVFISGGVPLIPAAAAYAAGVAIFSGGVAVGQVLGKTLYYMLH